MPNTTRERLQFHWDHGHFLDSRHPDGKNVTEADLDKLTFADRVAKQAVASWQSIDLNFDRITEACHNRGVYPDGEIGPATEAMYEAPRCGCSDFGDESGIHPWDEGETAAAIGRGHWANCHGANGWHKGVARIVLSRGSLPNHLTRPYRGFPRMIDAVLHGIRHMYGEIGLEWVWDWERKVAQFQTEFRLGTWAGGWIGLAQVPSPGRSCSASPLWAQHQMNFLSGHSSQDYIYELWIILGGHELGHVVSSGHTRGGPMNPTILRLKNTWRGTPSESLMRSLFGGEPVPGWPNFDGTDVPDGPGEILHWKNINHPLTFANGETHNYRIEMWGPRMPGPGFGASHWNFGKELDPIWMQVLLQPRMSEAVSGSPLDVAI